MEPQFDDELRQLKQALRQETFRFIIVGHNRYSLYKDIANWLRSEYAERSFLELRFSDKDYRQINDEIVAFKKGIVFISDFGQLFRKKNEAVCVAFNQRRDAFARLDIALICFIEPSEFIELPKKVPDWWSLRSLELNFYRETPDPSGEFLSSEFERSSLGGQTKEEKEAEIQRLLRQIESADPANKILLASLCNQIGNLFFELSSFDEASKYFEKSLNIYQQIKDKREEGTILNNISQIYNARGNYEQALIYLEKSLTIRQQISDKDGEIVTLNNIGHIYSSQSDYEQALVYFHKSLIINQEIGDKKREGIILNNIGSIYRSQGDYKQALTYYKNSLNIAQQIGSRIEEFFPLNNMGLVFQAQGEYSKALECYENSLKITYQIGDKLNTAIILTNTGELYYNHMQNVEKAIPLLLQAYALFQQIGSPYTDVPQSYLNDIREQMSEEKFNQIVQAAQNDPQF